MIPLYGFLEGDTVGLLILADEQDTVRDLAERLQSSAGVRVRHEPKVRVVYKGRVLDPRLTVEGARFEALERFDVRREEG